MSGTAGIPVLQGRVEVNRRVLLLAAALVVLVGCSPQRHSSAPADGGGRCAPPAAYLAQGHADPCLTPGDIRTSDPAVICVKGQASRVRGELTSAEWSVRRAEVMRRYSLGSLKGYTVDHLLPLEGGGSNDVENLMPQQQAIAKSKDKAENGLHAGICKPGVTVGKAHALQETFLRMWGAMTTVPPLAVAPTTTHRPTTTTHRRPPATKAARIVYFANCSEARAAGAAPLYRGEPGYRPELDRDGDGVACE